MFASNFLVNFFDQAVSRDMYSNLLNSCLIELVVGKQIKF